MKLAPPATLRRRYPPGQRRHVTAYREISSAELTIDRVRFASLGASLLKKPGAGDDFDGAGGCRQQPESACRHRHPRGAGLKKRPVPP